MTRPYGQLMSSNSVIVRRTAVAAPALMFGYGVLRFLDGRDGDRGNGIAWDAGHVAFFAAMVLFGVLAVALRPIAPAWARRTGTVAAALALFGAGCFLWVIAGDLSPAFREAAPLPDVLETGGSALFPLGMLMLLGLLVAARRAPVWSPLLFGAGIAAITVNLDLLPVASLWILAALAPLARRDEAVPSHGRPDDSHREVSRDAVRAQFKTAI
ncbi:hypothetical protein AMIS_34310 [Actinoplanes missouriensis 431]|uniref:Integral membrane protein n=2 Tax=Actinoplanes missouriensis TaxID=1866 RepID=I0H6L4_ACTM4|nr:hypothetical protein AMIS_34310 [Actinoplanes missouriensis 431]